MEKSTIQENPLRGPTLQPEQSQSQPQQNPGEQDVVCCYCCCCFPLFLMSLFQ